MIIAVDFDGTIVEHKYPAIGKEIPFATATLKQLIADGHKLILWSVREGELLQEAIDWCEARGVRFYRANADLEDDEKNLTGSRSYSRKIKAHLFIDDRNVGGLPDWGTIYQLVSRRTTLEDYLRDEISGGVGGGSNRKKKSWWKF